MCGINGIFNFCGICDDDIGSLRAMNASMLYRGPNDQDVWHDNNIGMAQVRLSIIGISNGKQPIWNEDKTLAIICNGEIYNYLELKEELAQRDHVFSTDSDSEVVLHLFEDFQENCLAKLRGMFAFAIYDTRKKRLFLARDICGKKPLYYAQLPGKFVFSSEIIAIKNHINCSFTVDWSVIKDYLKHSYSQRMADTWIQQIKKLEPGQYAYIGSNGISFQRYWKKKNTYTHNLSYEKARQQALDILRESVKIRLRSDVPVAILLSGGIDSSAIASLAGEVHDDIHCITVGYKGAPDCDERNLARKLTNEKKLIWHEVELDENDFAAYFDEYMKYLDEPVCDLSSIAQWAIYKKAKKLGFTVLLSGNGGDELFYGYPNHNKIGDYLDLEKNFLESTKKGPMFFLKFYLKHRKELKALSELKEHHLNFYYSNYSQLCYDWGDTYSFDQDNWRARFYDDEEHDIDKVYSYMFNIWLPNNCYYLSDKLGMGNSLELRCPFADKELIEYISSLPLEYKYHKNNPKGFLKDILRGIVPEYILNAPKRGFTPPNNAIAHIVKNYNSVFFNLQLTGYCQVVVDKFLHMHKIKRVAI
ncbi:MAG: asparagine synthase (glutamine-hydrolyzing) [Holosporaceae bacterium]|jgi:asparagine synthase (glutamine-hydrolysing)|nr:asparagine synthase (glutamine-hydrolyzing) [Holosporaceae bacterium]